MKLWHIFKNWIDNRQPRTDRKKINSLLRVYQQLDQHIAHFQRKADLRCVSGCGKCCENPNVEATVLELLPLAEELWKKEEAEGWLKKAHEVSGRGQCLFYKPDAIIPGHGRCSIYPFRPLVCRSFGYSAALDKHRQPSLVTCPIIKETCKTQTEAIAKNPEVFEIPRMSDYAQRILNIDPELGLQSFPINQAVQLALERVGFKRQLKQMNKEDRHHG